MPRHVQCESAGSDLHQRSKASRNRRAFFAHNVSAHVEAILEVRLQIETDDIHKVLIG